MTTNAKNRELLEAEIGYSFKKKQLLETAMTHSSYSNELRAKNVDANCNERLEFLGDSVLSLIVSEYLFKNFNDRPEGELTKMRASVVCERALGKFARKIGLGDYLHLGHGEEKSNGRSRQSILADAFEALLAAMYIDGGVRAASKFLLPYITGELHEGDLANHGDYKTLLQQIIQQSEGEVLEYVTVKESGPDHMKIFEVEVKLNSNIIGSGSGPTKREAEQNAAKKALELFGE